MEQQIPDGVDIRSGIVTAPYVQYNRRFPSDWQDRVFLPVRRAFLSVFKEPDYGSVQTQEGVGKVYSLESHARGYLIFSMFVFGTVGLFVHYIPLPSSIIALSRASLGAVFLFLLVRFRHMPISKEQIRHNLKLLIVSGICIGINWILLFEAFRHTTLAIASICYYMAPVFVILVSPVLLHEALTVRKVICVLLALLGMVFVSGIFENGLSGITDLSGVFLLLAQRCSMRLLSYAIRNFPYFGV